MNALALSQSSLSVCLVTSHLTDSLKGGDPISVSAGALISGPMSQQPGNSHLAGGGNGGHGGISDSKLSFRIRKFYEAEAVGGRVVTDSATLEYLLQTYREYQRKPQVRTSLQCPTRPLRFHN